GQLRWGSEVFPVVPAWVPSRPPLFLPVFQARFSPVVQLLSRVLPQFQCWPWPAHFPRPVLPQLLPVPARRQAQPVLEQAAPLLPVVAVPVERQRSLLVLYPGMVPAREWT